MGVGSGQICFRSDSWFGQKRRKCSVVCDPVLQRHWSVSPIFSLWNRWFLSRLWPVLSLNMDTCSWWVSRWYGSFLLEWGWFCLNRFCCLAFMIVLTSEYVVDLSFWAYVVPSFARVGPKTDVWHFYHKFCLSRSHHAGTDQTNGTGHL